MKKAAIGLLLISISCTFYFCQKRILWHVRVKGVLLDWYSRKPATGRIYVEAYEVHSKTSVANIELAEFNVRADGSFNQKVKAAVSGKYFVGIDKYPHGGFKQVVGDDIAIKPARTHDFGEILLPHPFVCKIILHYTSGKDRSFAMGQTYDAVGAHAVSTTLYRVHVMDETAFNGNDRLFKDTYHIYGDGISIDSAVSLPFGQRDTVSLELDY
jgi:hypothetical protein